MNLTREWMTEGTRRFLAAVDGMSQDDWRGDTRLPEWGPRELVAHVHLNARALQNLVRWARTGERTPMYDSAEQRNSDIERDAQLSPEKLRQLVHASAAALDADLDALDARQWQATVTTARGREVPATEIVWMRAREVVIHAIDLDTGLGFHDFPDEFNAALARDALGVRLERGEAATVAAWLTGRGEGHDIGAWI